MLIGSLFIWHRSGALLPRHCDGARPWSYIRRDVPVVPLLSRLK